MSISFHPIGPWPVVALLAAVVTFLTIWAYRERLKGTNGGWRWVALTLRLLAILCCFVASVRPTINFPEKKPERASVVLLIDRSKSLEITDEVNGQSRWSVIKKAVSEARKSLADREKDLDVKEYQFDSELREEKVDDKTKPEGTETALGAMMLEAVKRLAGTNIASIILFSDGASNSGLAPLVAANQLKGRLIPVITVGVGEENAGEGSKDIAVKDLVVGPVVFVKNQPEIRGTISVRGYPNKPIDIELEVEGEGTVSRTTVTAREGVETIPLSGLKYIPQTQGEKRVTLKIKPQDGELIQANNQFSTYLNVLGGGLKVLYLHGTDFSWEPRFLTQALNPAKEIHVDLKVLRQAAIGDRGLLEDSEFALGNYDVFILGSLPANFLTARQQTLLATAITRGAGLIMLGGRSSFGEGGWGNTALAAVLPVDVRTGDGSVEPKEGLKFVPNPLGLQSFVLRVGPTPADSQRIWDSLPPLPGANRFTQPKPLADILAIGGDGTKQPLLVGMNTGQGRTLAFGGETWIWARGGDEGRLAYLRFWRQAILWLAHKEDTGDSEVRLKLDRRRIPRGDKLEITAQALTPKKEPITNAEFTTTVTRIDPPETPPKSEPVQLFPQGESAKGYYGAGGLAGEYRVEVTGTIAGKEIGRSSARFNVYQDDREMENPAADRKLLREIAELTAGQSIAPEGLSKYLTSLDTSATERVSVTEKRIWDNWTFFLIFAALLCLEWWLRKRKGWV
jgi:uncharacterized membrane protein